MTSFRPSQDTYAAHQAMPAQQALDPAVRQALLDLLLAWADDELVLGHRDSEWTGFAPSIEEDVAFSSIAQDELGHAALLYGLAAELSGDDPDRLALRRPADAYRHAALIERPNGDWAWTIARHHLYDLADACRAEALSQSGYGPLAAAARKIAREEHYHLLHGAAWWERLRDGTAESRARLLAAAEEALPLALDVLGPTPGQPLLVAAGIAPPASDMQDAWRARIRALLTGLPEPERAGSIAIPDGAAAPRDARPISPDFAALHAEMTMVSASGMGERW